MLGDFSSRMLVNVFGYVYPAYMCYKVLEQRRVEVLREWCIYWFVLALWTAAERIADYVIFWIPLYYEAKVLFVLYLWHPKTQGALYLYDSALRPFLSRHERTIDQQVADGQAWAAGHISNHFNRAMGYVQLRAHEAIAYMQQVSQRQQAAAAGQAQVRPHAE
mmetsp:Transcript_6033/g.10894  ORF Transcript_6033/g.10894 Transcript_6033/m.10894 type:complete len:163 (-) Transcript_6033:204-692(-)